MDFIQAPQYAAAGGGEYRYLTKREKADAIKPTCWTAGGKQTCTWIGPGHILFAGIAAVRADRFEVTPKS